MQKFALLSFKISFRDKKQAQTPVGVISPLNVLNPTSSNVKQM